MELGYMAEANLEPEFVVYAAWDVEPLHRYPDRRGFLKNFIRNLQNKLFLPFHHIFLYRLHSLLTEDLSPDYRHLVTQLSELELLRCMDPALLKVSCLTNNFT